jgi:hypothetical protein
MAGGGRDGMSEQESRSGRMDGLKNKNDINWGVLCICSPTSHATSASDAHVVRLGPRMNHLTRFRDQMNNLRVWGSR